MNLSTQLFIWLGIALGRFETIRLLVLQRGLFAIFYISLHPKQQFFTSKAAALQIRIGILKAAFRALKFRMVWVTVSGYLRSDFAKEFMVAVFNLINFRAANRFKQCILDYPNNVYSMLP